MSLEIRRRIGVTDMTTGERIEYEIEKECGRDSLSEWCSDRDITIEEFYNFLKFGRIIFDYELWRKDNI